MSHSGTGSATQAVPGVPQFTPRPMLNLIAAVSSNGVIGAGGKLPWRLPEDLRFFKAQTMGCPVIMGRRTWESIGRALPGRLNIVVTRSAGLPAAGASVAASLDAALALCADAPTVFVIGGGDLYRGALPRADRMILTEIRQSFEGDVHFPKFDRGQWREARREPQRSASGLEFDFVWYERAAT